LRGVSRTGPYMHTGAFTTLAEVVAYYDKGGADPGDAGIVKDPLFRPLALQGTEGADLVRFLESLSGDTMTAPLLQDTHKP
jgi:cytochrome c peroxidase